MKFLLLVFFCCLSSIFSNDLNDKQFFEFTKKYCVECHGPEKQKGDRRYDQLKLPIANEDTLIDLQDMMDQLNLNEMPPKKAKQHPNDDQRMQAIAFINKLVANYHAKDREQEARVSLRRLNQREYINTLRDLFDMDMSMFDPTISFPGDQLSEHMDNIGQKLVTSGFLLDEIIKAADVTVEKAMMPQTKPKPQQWVFKNKFESGPEVKRAHKETYKDRFMVLYEQNQSEPMEAAYGYLKELQKGMPEDGIYEIRVRAQAVNRHHPFKPEDLGMKGYPAFRLGLVPGNIKYGDLYYPQPQEKKLAEVELKDGDPQWYTMRVHLDKGYTPRFTFPNGIYVLRNLHKKLLTQYPKVFPGVKVEGITQNRLNLIDSQTLPQIQISEVQIRGPLYEQWPKASQVAVLGNQKFELSNVYDLLKRFASKAYRRPVSDVEMGLLMRIVDNQKKSGKSSYAAFKDGLKAILSSPHFLYHNPTNKKDPVLFNYALASRMSYFFWSSLPDQELFDLAKNQKLSDPKVRAVQMRRMIKDPKADAFIKGFLDSWLNLRALDEIQPDRSKFAHYYSRRLGEAMRTETEMFTKHLLTSNSNVLDFLFSDFSFLNEDLAGMYGEKVELNHQFKKVQLSNRVRGGLLGQASVLKVTANGVDTSPVTRGVWLLENILGTPPPIPPPDVEPLDPDTRGAKNIRDQLKRHREDATCFDCHQKIDPLGFALENFDAVGAWRSAYDKRGKLKVDASGELPDGSQFKNIVGLKEALKAKDVFFVRHLIEKLMAYALGKHIEAGERYEVEQLVKQAKARGYRFQAILDIIVSSKMFES